MWFGLPSLACATTTLEKLSCSEREIVLYLKMQIYYSNCHIRSTLSSSSSYILHTRNNIVFSVKLHVNFLQIIMANFKNLGGKNLITFYVNDAYILYLLDSTRSSISCLLLISRMFYYYYFYVFSILCEFANFLVIFQFCVIFTNIYFFRFTMVEPNKLFIPTKDLLV